MKVLLSPWAPCGLVKSLSGVLVVTWYILVAIYDVFENEDEDENKLKCRVLA